MRGAGRLPLLSLTSFPGGDAPAGRYRPARHKFLALALAATVTGVTAGAAVANVAAAGCQVTYAVGSQRAGGFTGNVGITKFGDPLTSWTVRWSFTAGQSVTQAWNA